MASIIFPAGSGRNVVSWLDKVAENEKEKIGTDALSMKELKRLAALSDIIPQDEEVDVDSAEKTDETPVEDAENAPVSEEKEGEESEEGEAHEGDESVEFEAGESEEKAEGGDAVQQAADAVETAKGALEEAATALTDAGAEAPAGDDDMAEIPISMESAPSDEAMVEVQIDDVAPDAGVDPVADAEVGATPDVDFPPEEEATPMVEASTSKFYKIASLSPKNRAKLSEYWIKTLGYDPDWVKSLLKDYNK